MNVCYLRPLGNRCPTGTYVQIGVLALLAVGVLANWRSWRLPFFRGVACLAILMGYVILFSNSSEGHTYVIMLIGYQTPDLDDAPGGEIRSSPTRSPTGATFVIVVVMPVDVLCPPKVMQLFYGRQLNLWLLLALWLRMCWTAFIRIPEPMKRVEAA